MSARAAGAGPIHVAHVTNYLPGYHTHAGGAEFATLRTIQHIARAGVQCSVWCLKPDAAAGAGRDEESFELHAVPVVEDWLPPVARRYLEVAKWYAWQGDPLALHRAAQLWRESPPQLVHFHNCQFLSLGLLEQARRRQIPTVLSIYDYWLFCPLTTLTDADGRSCRREHGPGCLPCLPRLLTPVQAAFLARRRALFRRLRERVDRYVVLSEASGQLLTDFGIDPGQIEVIRVPMDLDAFQPEPNAPEGRLVVFAGWIQRRKGLAELLRAMPAVLSRHPDAKLEVLGMPVKWEPDYERQVSELASELGSSVVMRGKLPFGLVVRPIVAQCDAQIDKEVFVGQRDAKRFRIHGAKNGLDLPGKVASAELFTRGPQTCPFRERGGASTRRNPRSAIAAAHRIAVKSGGSTVGATVPTALYCSMGPRRTREPH